MLEGFHALKHALRFGADILEVATTDVDQITFLSDELSADLSEQFRAIATVVSLAVFEKLSPVSPRTGIIAIAKRPQLDIEKVLSNPNNAPIVLLEEPRDLGNIGAVIRVAAAAGAAAVFITGTVDIWHPNVVRGAAGLHFALPVGQIDDLPETDRPLVAIHPEGGSELTVETLPRRAILAFGTERHGLSSSLLTRSTKRLRIPMREGVSSLNLATSVAIVLYANLTRYN